MTVLALSPTHITTHGSKSSIRNFRLSLNDVDVELSCLGASITKVLLPNYSETSNDSSAAAAPSSRDDVVLSFASPREQYDDKNTPYFCSIVGRVANRIKDGNFVMMQEQQQQDTSACRETLEIYQLDKNNGPNHLHGGFDGFCHRIWNAEVIDDTAVEFTLISPDGDQGYPSAVHISARYSLVPIRGATKGAKLCLSIRASLLPGGTKATPIGLAQHSYFNLASHSSNAGVLDHVLKMPNCKKFTPVDKVLIPTRHVQRVEDAVVGNGRGKAMDFRFEKNIWEALLQYGVEVVCLNDNIAKENVKRCLANEDTSHVARVPIDGGAKGSNLVGGEPYGFDHNYVIDRNDDSKSKDELRLAAVLSHPPTRRSLRVSTTAPGVQVYTANYLDGTSPSPTICKDGARYKQWQALCLETQTYPNSIYPKEGSIPEDEKEFANGRCFILRPGGDDYVHDVEYEFSEAT